MAVGGDGAQGGCGTSLHGMQIDAVQIVARLFGRNGKASLVDKALQVMGGQFEGVRKFAARQIREIFGG